MKHLYDTVVWPNTKFGTITWSTSKFDTMFWDWLPYVTLSFGYGSKYNNIFARHHSRNIAVITTNGDINANYNTVVHNNVCGTKCNSHHHHHIVLAARISLTHSRHSSLSFIALGRSSGQQPVSSHSCWMYVRAGRPAFARPCVGIHKSTSLMSSSLLLQQCPACLVRLTWIVFVIGGRWPYSWCLVGCCFQDLFRIARSILV